MSGRSLHCRCRREGEDSKQETDSPAMCSTGMALRPRRSARRGESRQSGDILQGEGEGEGEGDGVRQQLQARVSGSLHIRGINAADRWTARPAGQLTAEEQARLERQRANKRRWARKERERCRQEVDNLKQNCDKLQKRNARLRRQVEGLQKWKYKLKTKLSDHTCRIPVATATHFELVVMPQLQRSKPKMNRADSGEGTSCALSTGPHCISCLGSLEARKKGPRHSPSSRGKQLTPAGTSEWRQINRSFVVNKREKFTRETRGAPSHTHSRLNIDTILESSSDVWSAVTLHPQQIAMEGAEGELQSTHGRLPVEGKGRSPHTCLQPVSPQQLSETGGSVTEQMSQSELSGLPDSHPSSMLELPVSDDDVAPTVLQAEIASACPDLDHSCVMTDDPSYVDTSLLKEEPLLNGDRDSSLSDFSPCDITIDAEDLENLFLIATSGAVGDSKENSGSESVTVSHGASATVTRAQSPLEVSAETPMLAAPMADLFSLDTQTLITETPANILDTSPSSMLTEKGFLKTSRHCREDSVWSPAGMRAAAPSSHLRPAALKRCMSYMDSPVSAKRSTQRSRFPSLPALLSRSIMEDMTFTDDDDDTSLTVPNTGHHPLLECFGAASQDPVIKI